ncbi:MAG: zinc-ribbon domain-containing protein [Methanoregula sp.]
MSKICPQCGNLNEDDKRFCTMCGNSLESPADQPGSSAIPQTGPVAAGAQPDPGRLIRILAGAGIAVIVIMIIFLVLTNPDMAGILPSSLFPGTAHAIVTPVVTSYVVIETPSPDPTPLRTEDRSLTIAIPDTSSASPAPTKAPVCPSDQRACDAMCTDTMTDRANCGTCGVSCSPSQVCQQGRCSVKCTSGETQCFDGCHNLSYNAQNCGTCGNACPVGLTCNTSVCVPTLPTAIPTYSG